MDLLDGLKAFVATAQTGSFTDAADRLGVSNRLTSKYVAQLEERVGARLLQRTTRKVGLTPTGQTLLERAPALLDELEDLLSDVSGESKHISGLLRIAAPVTFGEIRINDLVSRFLCAHPELSIDLRLNDSHVDLAAEGFDLAFRIGEPDIATLKARKLGDIASVLVASPAYLAKHGTPTTPESLNEHICIVDTNRRGFQRWGFHKEGEEHLSTPAAGYGLTVRALQGTGQSMAAVLPCAHVLFLKKTYWKGDCSHCCSITVCKLTRCVPCISLGMFCPKKYVP